MTHLRNHQREHEKLELEKDIERIAKRVMPISTGGGGGVVAEETDPIFSASEASLLEAGDKTKIDSSLSQSEADALYLQKNHDIDLGDDNLTANDVYVKKGQLNYLKSAGTLFEDFETIGDWTLSSATGTVQDEITNVRTGSHAIKLTCGSGLSTSADKVISTTIAGSGLMRFAVYIPSLVEINAVSILLSSTTNWSKYFQRSKAGSTLHEGWNVIDIEPSEWANTGGESWSNTFLRLRVRLTATSGTPSAILDSIYVNEVRRPKIVINFDDAWESQYDRAYAYMQPLGLRGTIYTIRDHVGETSYVTTEQIREMYADGWDFGTHGDQALGEMATQDEVEADIAYNETFLTDNGFTRASKHLAYPYGSYSDIAKAALQNLGYFTARTIIDRQQSNEIDDRYLLTQMGVYNTTSVATVQSWIDRAIAQGSCAMINFHRIVDSNADHSTKVLTADFQAIIDYIKTKVDANLLDATTISEWYKGLSGSINTDEVYQAKEAGKGLSTNDFTDALETKLSGIEEGAEANNISDADATDLTGGGETTLHTHPAGMKSMAFPIWTPATTDDAPLIKIPKNITLHSHYSKCIGGTNVVWQLQEYDSSAANPADTQTTDTTTTTSHTSNSTFSDASIDADDWLGIKITSVSGTVSLLLITVYYTEN